MVQPDAESAHTLSERRYLLAICAVMASGLLISVGTASLGAGTFSGPAGLVLSVIGILAVFLGYEVTCRTSDWRGSLVGHLLANAGFGLALSPVASVALLTSLLVTVIGVSIIGLIAAVRPSMVVGWGSFLIASGILFVLLGIIARYLPGASSPGIHAHIFGFLLLSYLDHYLTRASRIARTADNAVDSACAFYMDIVNQAVRLADRI